MYKNENITEYELIDCGNGYKLERFGKYILSRPEPQALWKSSLTEKEWFEKVDAHFERDKTSPEKGIWKNKKNMPEQWHININNITFRLGLTGFKHIGIFPEQVSNWNFIEEQIKTLKSDSLKPKLLNLFAYTGGASLIAKKSGADVTHVDSVKQVVHWATENMKLSNLDNIRWLIDDASKFVAREVRRETLYDGIILDPPAYGRGPDGEKWIMEDMIDNLLRNCKKILKSEKTFLILNVYSMGFSPILTETLVKSHFDNLKNIQTGELFVEDNFGKKLPLSVFCRAF